MTIEEQIKLNPWMANFKDSMRESCHDCGVGIGELHTFGCDAARCLSCKGQRLSCDCKDGDGDIFDGMMMSGNVKFCIENDLWCRDFLVLPNYLPGSDGIINDKLFPLTDSQIRLGLALRGVAGINVKWHVPCNREDFGAHPDLNATASFINLPKERLEKAKNRRREEMIHTSWEKNLESR